VEDVGEWPEGATDRRATDQVESW